VSAVERGAVDKRPGSAVHPELVEGLSVLKPGATAVWTAVGRATAIWAAVGKHAKGPEEESSGPFVVPVS